MEAGDQAEGERQVQVLLVDELMKLGLGRPTTVSKDGFQDMIKDLTARLAYMSPDGLGALAEHCATRAGGPKSDRFPISKDILQWAGEIEPPPVGSSPLMCKVLRHELGGAAVAGGWSFDLIRWLRKNRTWPNAYQRKLIAERGEDAAAQAADLARRFSDGETIPQAAKAWLQARDKAQAEALKIREGKA